MYVCIYVCMPCYCLLCFFSLCVVVARTHTQPSSIQRLIYQSNYVCACAQKEKEESKTHNTHARIHLLLQNDLKQRCTSVRPSTTNSKHRKKEKKKKSKKRHQNRYPYYFIYSKAAMKEKKKKRRNSNAFLWWSTDRERIRE